MNKNEFNILLIEDSAGDARLIREMILDVTYEHIDLNHVTTLKDGIAALEISDYDAVLLDLSLPDSHGIDTLLKMRSHAPNTAIVVLTGLDDQTVGIESVQMGAQDYLPKGDVDSKWLVRSLRYAIERHRTEMALRKSEQEYRSLIDDVFDTSMVAVLILDQSFRVVWCNEATEIYFGVKRENILGRDKRKLIDEDLKCVFADPDDYASRLLHAYDEGAFTDRFECHVVVDEGREERWLEHWSQPIREGMYSGGRIEQYTDITERKMLEVAELEQRQFAEALRDIATILTSSLDLHSVLGRVFNNLYRVLPHDSASITIVDDDHTWVATPRTDNRNDLDIVIDNPTHTHYGSYLTHMYRTREPLIVHDMSVTDSSVEGSYVGAPIQLQSEIIGFVSVFSQQVEFFTEDDADHLVAFAELSAIAIQNARLYTKSQDLAMIEERQRLARELHDSVSQTLFTCQAIAESALRRWDKDPSQARELLDEVYQLTATALAEMRILLLELRPKALTQIGLKQLFEQYLQPIQTRRQFEFKLAIEDIGPLPPDVQIAFYRISQEALNNIDKHANASLVEIRAGETEDRVELHITDDGAGFSVGEVNPTSLGLNIMRERADQIQADLSIDSMIGKGTQIRVSWTK